MSQTAGPDILIIAPGPLDLDRPGRTLRSLQLTHMLDAAGFEVTYALPNPEAFSDVRFRLATSEPDSIEELLRRHTVVISTGTEYNTREVARRTNIQIFDVADQRFSDLVRTGSPPASRMRQLLDSADLMLCATPYQRDLWMGAAASHGRFGDAQFAQRDPLELFLVMPYGHAGSHPEARFPRIKGVLDGVEGDDILCVWNAGYDPVLDPEPVVTAMRGIAEISPQAKLLFLPPRQQLETQTPTMQQLIEHAQSESVYGRNVFFLTEEMNQKDYTDVLCEADAVVCCTRYAADSRFWAAPEITEAIWAQVPILTSRGSFMAALVDDLHLGYAATPGDPVDIAEKLVHVADPTKAAKMRTNIKQIHRNFSWEVTIRPLVEFLENVPPVIAPDAREAVGGLGHAMRRVVSRLFE